MLSENEKERRRFSFIDNGKYTLDRNIKYGYWNEFREKYKQILLVSPDKIEYPIIDIDNLRSFCRKNYGLSDMLIIQLIKGKISKYRCWTVK